MNAIQRDRIVGISLMVVAMTWSVIVYKTIPAGQDDGAIGPRAFPLFLGLILVGLCALMFLRTLLSGEVAREDVQIETFAHPISGREIRLAAGVFLLIILYGFLMQKIGFLLSTTVIVAAALGLVQEVRRPMLFGALAIAIPVSCWLIFGELLGVYLPHGSWVSLG